MRSSLRLCLPEFSISTQNSWCSQSLSRLWLQVDPVHSLAPVFISIGPSACCCTPLLFQVGRSYCPIGVWKHCLGRNLSAWLTMVTRLSLEVVVTVVVRTGSGWIYETLWRSQVWGSSNIPGVSRLNDLPETEKRICDMCSRCRPRAQNPFLLKGGLKNICYTVGTFPEHSCHNLCHGHPCKVCISLQDF